MTWKKAQPKDRFDFRESTTCSECLCMCIRCFERKKNTTKARNLSNKNKRNYRFPALLLFVCVARKVLIWRFQSIARVLVNYSSDLKLDTQQRKRKKRTIFRIENKSKRDQLGIFLLIQWSVSDWFRFEWIYSWLNARSKRDLTGKDHFEKPQQMLESFECCAR